MKTKNKLTPAQMKQRTWLSARAGQLVKALAPVCTCTMEDGSHDFDCAIDTAWSDAVEQARQEWDEFHSTR